MVYEENRNDNREKIQKVKNTPKIEWCKGFVSLSF